MKTTDCRHTQREIDSNELNQQLSDSSMTHISGCLPCRELLERSSSLRNLVASLGSVTAPQDFDMRLRARLASERRSNVTWINFLRQTPGVPAIAFAFSLLVIISVALFMRSSGTPEVAQVPRQVAPHVGPVTPAAVDYRPVDGSNFKVNVVAPKPVNRSSEPRKAMRPQTELAAFTSNPGPGSRDFGVGAAPTVSRNGVTNANLTSPVVSLSAPAQPVVVSLRDNNGATRTISLPPVSFGSQRLGYQSETLASSGKGAW
ncbi:MAG: hypothetical protein ABI596_13665 [Pyrinomonadaceae bacterium]